MKIDEKTIYLVLSIINEIPEGYVTTYGTIAKMIDKPKNSRLIGKILNISNTYGEYACYKVVNHQGRLAPNYKEQKELLLKDGITFKDNNHVDLKKHLWPTNFKE